MFFILIVMIVGSFIEAISLGLVVPVIRLLGSSRSEIDNSFIRNVLWDVSDKEFVFVLMTAMVLIFTLKTIFLVWKVWFQKGFANRLAARISSDLYKSYLGQPYGYFLTKNSSTLVRNSISGNVITEGVIDPFLFLISEGSVTLFLCLFLIYLEPIGTTLTLLLLLVGAWSYRKPTASRIGRWGEILNICKAKLIQQVNHGIGGIKEVIMFRREGFFVALFEDNLKEYASINQKLSFVQALPRYFLELLTMVCFAVLVSSMVAFGGGIDSVIPVLGLFGVAAFRILPATYQILNCLQSISTSNSFLQEVLGDLSISAKAEPTGGVGEMEFEVLEIQHLKYSYDPIRGEALSDVSIQINRGEAVGLVGQSGSGKSTLVDLLIGLLKPQEGVVLVNELNINTILQWWRSSIGYVSQTIFLTDDSLKRNIAFGLPDEEIDEVAVREALKSAQLEDFVASLPEGLDTAVGERGVRLSGGQRQRIGIARALYHRPSVLVLDEATSSLDSETEHEVMKAIQALQGDKTVIIVAHRLSTVEYCDRLYRLDAGRIVDEGTFGEVMNRSQS